MGSAITHRRKETKKEVFGEKDTRLWLDGDTDRRKTVEHVRENEIQHVERTSQSVCAGRTTSQKIWKMNELDYGSLVYIKRVP